MLISMVGYRGTGKSTVGKMLAQSLSLPFFDSDQAITAKTGHSISDIFDTKGEKGFRAIESSTVQDLMTERDGVIAWGGGVVLDERNRTAIRKSDRVIWLNASAEHLFKRLHGSDKPDESRPALTELKPLDEIKFNLKKREALYRTCADEYINTDDLTIEEIVDLILRDLKVTS